MSRWVAYGLLLLAWWHAAAGELTLTVGGTASSYRDPDVEETSAPVAVSGSVGDWRLDASVSHLRQHSAPSVMGGSRLGVRPMRVAGRTVWVPVRYPRPDGSEEVVAGWGDLQLGVSRRLDLTKVDAGPQLNLRAGVKLPTGSKGKGFSSGKTDWSLGASVQHDVGPVSLALTSSYSWLGRQDSVPTHNIWSADISMAYGLDDGLQLALDYAWSQSATPGNPSARLLGWTTTVPLGEQNRLALTLSRGYSNADPYNEISLNFSHDFE